jgi:L-alanine-DL-glutamate epimerase-like enolase superfamily enzyme
VPRIAGVDLRPLAFPLERPFRAAVRRIASTDVLLATLRADDGRVGHGYAFAFGAEDLAPILATARALAPLLEGGDALAPERHWQSMHRALALAGAGGPALAALAALDIALWDLAGQLCGQPLYRLLGGARERTPVYGSGGSLDLTAAELAAEAAGFAREGYGAYKFKAGHGLDEDTRRLHAVREATGGGVRLIVDGNQQWTAKQALRAARAFEAMGLWWLEEPVPAGDIAACAEVRAASPVEIATGETNFGVAEFSRLLAARAADIVMPNLQRVGGITGWRKVAALAEAAGVPIASHVYAEIGVHLMCGVPNGLVLEVLPWWPRLFREPLRIEGGEALAPETPGLGLTLDADVVERHRA